MSNTIVSKKSYSVNVNPSVFGYPENVNLDDVRLFAGIAFCDTVKKEATSSFLDDNHIFTPAALQEVVVNMGLVPCSLKVESFSKKVEQRKVERLEKDGIEFVHTADGSCIPVLVLLGIHACFNTLRVRKSRNKKDVVNLTADLFAILSEIEKGKNPDSFQEVFNKKKEMLYVTCQRYISYNPDVLDVPVRERIETHSKHGDFFFTHGITWEHEWESAVSKGKNAEITTHITPKKQTKKESLLENAEAFLHGNLVTMTAEELIAELARYIREQ